MIEVNEMTFAYQLNKPVINNLSFKINKNDKVSIIGKSGCGKTTLLFLLAGILKATTGEILISSQKLESIRSQTGIIFQNGGLFPWKTVYDNLALGLRARKLDKLVIDKKVNEVLKELDILHLKDCYLKQLSGGQKQRVSIGRVLVLKSDLLLLDEPSSALDAFTKDQFQKTMLTLYHNHEVTSIIVTHDIEEAVFLGQKIIIMKNGTIGEIVENELYGCIDAKHTLSFYEKCIKIRKKLEL
ncbi:MAG: transporter related protein [Haloplasmataceae bacterium]|jgi:NitT/TauT family transport system ATP-binding protein|nr:transporter related protein [Haloplasmataceae bacterium]